jgi:hypothetical protein
VNARPVVCRRCGGILPAGELTCEGCAERDRRDIEREAVELWAIGWATHDRDNGGGLRVRQLRLRDALRKRPGAAECFDTRNTIEAFADNIVEELSDDDPILTAKDGTSRAHWQLIVSTRARMGALKLDPLTRLVGLALAQYANGTTRLARPGVRKMLDETGLNEDTIYDRLKRLREAGIIGVKVKNANGKAKVYEFLRWKLPTPSVGSDESSMTAAIAPLEYQPTDAVGRFPKPTDARGTTYRRQEHNLPISGGRTYRRSPAVTDKGLIGTDQNGASGDAPGLSYREQSGETHTGADGALRGVEPQQRKGRGGTGVDSHLTTRDPTPNDATPSPLADLGNATATVAKLFNVGEWMREDDARRTRMMANAKQRLADRPSRVARAS